MEQRSEHAVVFMAKWPEPGRTKTRLCPPLSHAEAAALARCFLLDMLTDAAQVGPDCWIAFAPREAAPLFRGLVGDAVGLILADAPNLGGALRRAQEALLARGYRRVALVGSDLPHLPPTRYAEAFTALDGADVAVGPSADGGYYLLASHIPTPSLFEAVAWSTEVVFDQTRARAAEAGLTVTILPACDDVDTVADLPRLLAHLRARPGAGHTLGVLEHLAILHAGLAADFDHGEERMRTHDG